MSEPVDENDATTKVYINNIESKLTNLSIKVARLDTALLRAINKTKVTLKTLADNTNTNKTDVEVLTEKVIENEINVEVLTRKVNEYEINF